MVVFNPVKKEIDIKIVYYGPALCGKTSNLQSVHLSLNPDQRGELVSLATKDDRTLFFDFLPIELDNIKGFKTRFHIYTVPGQVLYTLTRKAVLTGVDGIIFVADSEEGKMEENIESLDDLKENLKYYNKDLRSIPFVMQYNKRDLENLMPVSEMDQQLNSVGAPSFEASALSGKGVMQTLTMCCKMVLKQIQEKSHTSQASVQATQAPEDLEQSSPELPQLTLIDSTEEESVDTVVPQEAHQDLSLPNDGVVEDGFTELPGSREEDELLVQEEAFIDNQQDTVAEEDLLVSEPEIQLGTPELQADEPARAPFAGNLEKTGELDFKNEGLQEDTVNTSPQTLSETPAATEDPAPQESKNICPRCSLKFKPNVKQCPICRVTLLSEGGEENVEPPVLDEVPAPLEPITQEHPPSPEVAEGANGGNGLQIVACGQPSQTSHTAISVPLTLKVNGTPQEFKVDLAIDFGNGLLK